MLPSEDTQAQIISPDCKHFVKVAGWYCNWGNDNVAYMLKKDQDTQITSITEFSTDVDRIVNDELYYMTDGSFVALNKIYNTNENRLCDVYYTDCAVMINSENKLIFAPDYSQRDYYHFPGNDKLSNVIDASVYYAVTEGNKLYLWDHTQSSVNMPVAEFSFS